MVVITADILSGVDRISPVYLLTLAPNVPVSHRAWECEWGLTFGTTFSKFVSHVYQFVLKYHYSNHIQPYSSIIQPYSKYCALNCKSAVHDGLSYVPDCARVILYIYWGHGPRYYVLRQYESCMYWYDPGRRLEAVFNRSNIYLTQFGLKICISLMFDLVADDKPNLCFLNWRYSYYIYYIRD